MKTELSKISDLYCSKFKEDPSEILLLKADGSNRKIFRVFGDRKQTCIAVIGETSDENVAFISFTNSFNKLNFNVPEIIIVSEDNNIYLQTDLGNETLYDRLLKVKMLNNTFNSELLELYQKVILNLIKFQTESLSEIDLGFSYPYHSFDKRSILWDLNYFKYNFLKFINVEFHEDKLESDFESFTKELISGSCEYFMYRDFQSRNIMIKDNEPFFIDYQGGRKGPLEYDLTSLLYDAKANLSMEIRENLIDFYIKNIQTRIKIDEDKFRKRLPKFALIRILQAMGTYGYRGLFEKKFHFVSSIQFAINNLQSIFTNSLLDSQCKELNNVFYQLIDLNFKGEWAIKANIIPDKLNILIQSFSYKKGYPTEYSENGGGFVFDCRAIENPGRYNQYKKLSGLDEAVITFLGNLKECSNFITQIEAIVSGSVDNYLIRKFNNLSINFGCTGGQHRSVYFAEIVSKKLSEKYLKKLNTNVIHSNKSNWV